MCCIHINSFWGMSLPTAGVVLGWLSGIGSLLMSIIYIGLLAGLDGLMQSISESIGDNSAISGAEAAFVATILSVQIVMSLVNMLASILVVVGIHRNSHLMLLPWLINNAIVLGAKVFFGVLFICGAFAETSISVGVPLTVFVLLVIKCWMWAAVYSLFQDIRSSKNLILETGQMRIKSNNYELFGNSLYSTEKRY